MGPLVAVADRARPGNQGRGRGLFSAGPGRELGWTSCGSESRNRIQQLAREPTFYYRGGHGERSFSAWSVDCRDAVAVEGTHLLAWARVQPKEAT